MANFFRIRNFERFQHYKDRNPPWIRLYGALWRDRAFFRLPDALKAHLIGLFALAARLDNRIPEDPEWLAHELCASEPINLEALFASGFLIPDAMASDGEAGRTLPDTPSVSGSGSGSDPLHSEADCPDEEARRGGAGCAIMPDAAESYGIGADPGISQQAPAQRRRCKRPELKWPPELVLSAEMREFAERLGIDAGAEFEAWRDDCAAHDRRYADWQAAWRGRCRNALRFGRRSEGRSRASPGQTAMDVALRRLREASERERLGSSHD
jgi:hypothetical protein